MLFRSREYLKESQLNKTYLEMGIKSPQTIAAEIGVDWRKEQENFASLREQQQKNDDNKEKTV